MLRVACCVAGPPATLDFRLWTLDFATYAAYAQMERRPKKVLRTSLRSETQATDSTWMGCRAKRAATKALRQYAPVICLRRPKSSSELRVWKRRLVAW